MCHSENTKALGAHPPHFRDEKTSIWRQIGSLQATVSLLLKFVACRPFLSDFLQLFIPLSLIFTFYYCFLFVCFLPTELFTNIVGEMSTIIQGDINILSSLHSQSLVSSFVCVKLCPLYMQLLSKRASGSVFCL